jgi:hypothetical protein
MNKVECRPSHSDYNWVDYNRATLMTLFFFFFEMSLTILALANSVLNVIGTILWSGFVQQTSKNTRVAENLLVATLIMGKI